MHMSLRLPYLLGQCGYFGYNWKEARKETSTGITGTGTAIAIAPDMPSPPGRLDGVEKDGLIGVMRAVEDF